ncbi:MAG: helix-hairpin-helix domain-containing protein, partial [Clostridia bacterium]
DEAPGDVLLSFLSQYYEDASLLPREVIAQAMSEDADALVELLTTRRGARVTLHVPQRGEKRALVAMAAKNAEDALQKRNARQQTQYVRTVGAAEELGRALGLAVAPRRIEGFDISNTQGVLSVASMVVMIDGQAAKQQYRHFRIKTVEGANDFASMAEVLGRRFRHGLQECEERLAAGLDVRDGRFSDLPDLILIDGGPEQLAFARRAMLEAGGNVPMFGLAKRLEEIFLPDREDAIMLDRHSPALLLIQRLRDEAHRFAITYHRALRGKQSVHSKLEDIPSIGPARRKALLKHFHALAAIRAATVDELAAVPGMTRPAAETVWNFFRE